MNRVRLLIAEAWASIRQNVSTTVASTLTVLIGMVLLGLFLAFFTLVLSWSSYIQKELQVHVYSRRRRRKGRSRRLPTSSTATRR